MQNTRLPKVAGALYVLSIAALITYPITIGLAVVFPSLGLLDTSTFTDMPRADWPLATWMGLFVGLLPGIFFWIAVNNMRKLFAVYRQGDPLAPQAGVLIRAIGSNLLIGAVLVVVVHPVQSILMSLSNPVGERMLSVSLNSSTIAFVLVAGLLSLIGWSMTEATKIAAENREFV